MITKAIIELFTAVAHGLFELIGDLPIASISLDTYVFKFFGWGCYMIGTGAVTAIFISIFGWSLAFLCISIFRFIKTYVPVA